MPTFLMIEILNPRHFPPKHFNDFDGELDQEMRNIVPSCLPIVSSSVTGRKYFKPGNMVSPNSKCIISRFDSQRQVDDVMRSRKGFYIYPF